MVFEEKNKKIIEALNNGKIVKLTLTEEQNNIIKKAIKKYSKKSIIVSLVAAIICLIVLVILIFLHKLVLEKIGFVIVKNIIFIIPILGILSPIYAIYNLINKNKIIKQNKYNCYVGKVEKYVEDKFGYKIDGISEENIDFLLGFAPKERLKPNDNVIILSIDDSLDLITPDIFYKGK